MGVTEGVGASAAAGCSLGAVFEVPAVPAPTPPPDGGFETAGFGLPTSGVFIFSPPGFATFCGFPAVPNAPTTTPGTSLTTRGAEMGAGTAVTVLPAAAAEGATSFRVALVPLGLTLPGAGGSFEARRAPGLLSAFLVARVAVGKAKSVTEDFGDCV